MRLGHRGRERSNSRLRARVCVFVARTFKRALVVFTVVVTTCTMQWTPNRYMPQRTPVLPRTGLALSLAQRIAHG